MNCNVFPLFRGASRQRLKHQIDQQSTYQEDGRTSSYFSKEHSDATRHAPPGSKKNTRNESKYERKQNRYPHSNPTKTSELVKDEPTTQFRNNKRPPQRLPERANVGYSSKKHKKEGANWYILR